MGIFRKRLLVVLAVSLLASSGFCARAEADGGCAKRYSALKNDFKLYSGTLLEKSDPKLFQIFRNLEQDPKYALTESDLGFLRAKDYLGITEQWRQTNALVKKLNVQIAGIYRAQVRAQNEGFIVSFLKKVGKALFPMYKLFQTNGGTNRIAHKILEDPSYQLTDAEIAFLSRKHVLQDMQRFQADVGNGLQRTFARVSAVKTAGKALAWSVAVSGTALGLVDNKYISSKDSFNEDSPDGMSRYDDKVELIFLSPMPHASIRIGGTVYNYGVLDVERWDLDTFRKTVGFGEKFSGSHTRVELKLTDEEKEKLRDYLEEDVGKIYPLAIPFVDCVSQTNKAVKFATGIDVPPVADRSESLSIAYYKMRKLLGDDRIGDVTFAANGNPAVEKGKDAVVNTLDGLMFMKYGPTLLLTTPVMDHFRLTLDPQTGEWK